MKKSKGFSLIEAMVALIIISVGVLGLVAMQGRTIQYSNESTQRDRAIMLASDLIEMMRSNRSSLIAPDRTMQPNSAYYKAAGTAFPTTITTACQTTAGCTVDQMATTQLATWARQVQNALPIGPDLTLLTNQYIICRTNNASAANPCSGNGSSVLIQIAWLGKDVCPVGTNCTALDANRREFYRVSFQP
ncbi:type IV pilus modification protein PilV [Pseudomonas nitroreducens]|uniref:type IV pilus modification protein PilV n=1 Tax=Pseudomonas nitroreducens TaxID=46680 RepID=UPI003D294961